MIHRAIYLASRVTLSELRLGSLKSIDNTMSSRRRACIELSEISTIKQDYEEESFSPRNRQRSEKCKERKLILIELSRIYSCLILGFYLIYLIF